jgi:hypothetical protein
MNQQTAIEISRYLRIISYVQIGIGIAVQATVLSLLLAEFRRHRRRSFVLLSISTALGILVLVATLSLYFIPADPMLRVWVYTLGFLFYSTQAVLAVVGTIKLLRDYRDLAAVHPAGHYDRRA